MNSCYLKLFFKAVVHATPIPRDAFLKKKKKLSGKIQFGNAEFCIPFLKSHILSLQEVLQQRILFDFG